MPATAPGPPDVDSLTLLWLDGDPDYRSLVAEVLEAMPDVDLLAETDPSAALERLDDVDCVVSELELSTTDGLAVLADVREADERRPFVLHAETPLAEVGEAVLATDHADYVRKDWDETSVELVVQRARTLVERNRFRATARRLAAAVDACRDPVVVVGADDTIEYANAEFASALSPARTDLRGRHWTDLFTEESVEQLQHDAIPVGTEGWTWSGPAVLAAGDDEVAARATLVRIDDGSKVFAFRDLEVPA